MAMPIKALKRMSEVDIIELDKLLRKAIGILLQHSTNLIDELNECKGDECIESLNAGINDLMADVQLLMNKINKFDLEVVIDFTKAIYETLQYLTEFGLLNADYVKFISKYKEPLNKATIKDLNDAFTSIRKVHSLLLNTGRVLTHAACMARFRGLTRVGNYVLDKALLILGMALDETFSGNNERAIYLLASAFLALHGKEEEASKALARAGYEYENLDRFLNFCASLTKLYELGIRFSKDDYLQEYVL